MIPRLQPYTLPLRRPLRLARGVVLRERKGLLLQDPRSGDWSEAAPLPGFSQESLEEVTAAAQARDWTRFPSLAFAYECLQERRTRPAGVLRSNRLWFAAEEGWEELIRKLPERAVVKVKPAADPAACLALLRQRPDVRLRLDPNRRWSMEECLRWGGALPAESIDYFEEPLADPEAYADLWARMPLPVALDESLLESGWEELAATGFVRALVLKPTLLGSAHAAYGHGLPRVISSCFESPVGLHQLACLCTPDTVHGINTMEIFRTVDLTKAPWIAYSSGPSF